MSKGRSNRNTRKRLYDAQEGLCYYCKGPMVLVEFPSDQNKSKTIKNMCTIEHLIIPVLGESKKGAQLVAACAKCNQDKAREYEKRFYKEHKRRSTPKRRRKRAFFCKPLVVKIRDYYVKGQIFLCSTM